MIKETVTDVSGTQVVTETGMKIPIGDKHFSVGETIWTDGKYAFGNDKKATAPVIHEFGGSSAKSKIFIWCGNNDNDGKICCRIYTPKKLDYIQVNVNFPDTTYEQYNSNVRFAYSGTKLAWLFISTTTTTVRQYVLTEDGWSAQDIALAEYTDLDFYVDSNNDVVIRIFMPAKAAYSYDTDLGTLIAGNFSGTDPDVDYMDSINTDSPSDGYYKVYKNGELYSTESVTAELASLIPSTITDTETAANDTGITFGGLTSAGVSMTPYVDVMTNIYNAITKETAKKMLDCFDSSHQSNYYYKMSKRELEKRKPKGYALTKLIGWDSNQLDIFVKARTGIFITTIKNISEIGDVGEGGSYTDRIFLYNLDGLLKPEEGIILSHTFYFISPASCIETKKYRTKTGSSTIYSCVLDAENGDLKDTPVPDGWVTPPSTCRWCITDLTHAQQGNIKYGYGVITNFPQSSTESKTDSVTINLGDGYSLVDTTLTDGTWTADLEKLGVKYDTLMPCFTNMSSEKVIIDGTIINKTDNSISSLVSYERNSRMPLVDGYSQAEIVEFLTK